MIGKMILQGLLAAALIAGAAAAYAGGARAVDATGVTERQRTDDGYFKSREPSRIGRERHQDDHNPEDDDRRGSASPNIKPAPVADNGYYASAPRSHGGRHED